MSLTAERQQPHAERPVAPDLVAERGRERRAPVPLSVDGGRKRVAATAQPHEAFHLVQSDDLLKDLLVFLKRAPELDDEAYLRQHAETLRERIPGERQRLDALDYCEGKYSVQNKLGYLYAMLGNFLGSGDVEFLQNECRHYNSGQGSYESCYYELQRDLLALELKKLSDAELAALAERYSYRNVDAAHDYEPVTVGAEVSCAAMLRYPVQCEQRRRAEIARSKAEWAKRHPQTS